MGCCFGTPQPKIIWFDEFQAGLPTLAGKKVVITGTTSGTGYVAALTCGRKGAEVFLLNRQSERATSSFKQLQEECPRGKFYSVPCDLTSFASVREAAATVTKMTSEGGVDVLCCNAGVMAFPDQATADGFDIQMQTNHLSHFLLTKELLPCLRAAVKSKGEARIVHHSSGARFGGPLEAKYFGKGGDLGGDAPKACFERYHQTKLANILFTYALDSRLKASGDSNIKVLCCTPGMAATSLLSNLEDSGTALGPMKLMLRCMFPLMLQSPEDGTMPLLTAIAGKDVQSADLLTPSRGGWRKPQEAYGPVRTTRQPLPNPETSFVCSDPEAQKMLWAESEKAIGETFELTGK